LNKILIRSIYKNDYELIDFWMENPLINKKIKKFKITNKKKIKIVISDNIRIGLQFKKKDKEYYFIYPSYYTFGYLSKKFTDKIYGKKYEDVNYF